MKLQQNRAFERSIDSTFIYTFNFLVFIDTTLKQAIMMMDRMSERLFYYDFT